MIIITITTIKLSITNIIATGEWGVHNIYNNNDKIIINIIIATGE